MKRTFLFLAAFAVVATSCSKNTLVDTPSVVYDASTINFAPSTGLSKANDNGIDQVKAGFEVHALTPNAGESGGLELLFAPATPVGTDLIYKFDGVWKWMNSADKLWPTDAVKYPVTFIASLPSPDFGTNYAQNDPADYSWTKTLTQADDVTKHEDHLVAKYVQDEPPLKGALGKLLFEHITAGILFNVTIPENWSVVVKEVIYHNLHKASTFHYLDTTWTAVPAVAGDSKYRHVLATGAQTIETGAIGADAFIKAIPQVAPKSNFSAFITEGTKWTASGAWPTSVATDALAEGTYVELQYALVDAKGLCVVGRVKDKEYIKDGALVKATEDQFLRVGYLVDITTEAKSLKRGYRYTYNIVLGTTDATGGMVLDPTLIDKDGGPGDDSGKKPGDDVNEKAEEIGFTVDVVEWTDAKGNFEPLP